MESVKNLQKLVDEAKQDAIKLAKELAEMIEALRPIGLTDTILNDREFRKYITAMGMGMAAASKSHWEPPVTPATTAKPKAGKKRKGRGPKTSDDDIVKYLKTERTVGEIRKNLGQLVPKRLGGLEKDGKISLRKDGLKKFWSAIK
jgi:hypothetical protein